MIAVVLLLSTFPVIAWTESNVSSISFVSIGDSGDVSQGLSVTATAVLTRSAAPTPAFRLLLGDNFYESGVNGLDDPLWQSTFELPVSDDGVEYLPVLGNHDYRGELMHYTAIPHTRLWVFKPLAEDRIDLTIFSLFTAPR